MKYLSFKILDIAHAASEKVCETGKNSALCASNYLDKFGLTLGSFWAITFAALVDSINPCAIAVLLILLGSLISINERKNALKAGLLFCLGLFIAYFLAGIGLFSVLDLWDFAKISEFVHVFIGSLSILIGLLNIKDFFWYGKGMISEIPRAWRPTLKKFLRSITSPLGAFISGFVVILFELPCTGGPYLFTIGYLSSLSKVVVLPILFYYNLIFILPLLVIIALIYFGFSTVEATDKWKNRNIRILHLVAGLILLGLGIWVVLQ